MIYLEKMNCILCKSAEYKILFTKENARYVKCSNCGLVYQNPQPDFGTIESQYDDFSGYWKEYEEKLKADISTKTFYISILDQHFLFNKEMEVLDFGSGPGTFLSLIKPHVKSVQGIELSPWAADFGKEIHKVDIIQGNLFDIDLENKKFDLITMWHVIEHLPDPYEYLKKLKEHLKVGGYVAIATPNVDSWFAKLFSKRWTYFIPNEHIFLFSERTLEKLLDMLNFEIISCNRYLYKKVDNIESFLDFWKLALIRFVKKILSSLPVNKNIGPFKFYTWKIEKDKTAFPKNSNKDGIIIIAKLIQ